VGQSFILNCSRRSECRIVYYTLTNQNSLDSTRVKFTSGQRLMEELTRSSIQQTKCNKQSDSKCYQCDKYCMIKNICYQLIQYSIHNIFICIFIYIYCKNYSYNIFIIQAIKPKNIERKNKDRK